MRIDKFVNSLCAGHLSAGRYRACDICHTVLRRVCAFHGSTTLSLHTIFSRRFLYDFREHLLLDGLSHNTVSFYFSELRSIYTLAVESGHLPNDSDLFSQISFGSVPTEKRAISPEVIARLHAANLSDIPRLERCRDLFMLSLHLQGMPFVDLAHLRKSDLQGDFIVYRRQKTSGTVCVSVIGPAKTILEKYAEETGDSPYLLPLITLSGAEGHKQYQTALRRHNRQLKDLAKHLGIKDVLSTYVPRHSWATIAYHNGVDVGVVSQGMGHHTEEVTRIYLSSFDQNRLTEANHIVLRAILRPILEGEITEVREEVRVEIAGELQYTNNTTGSLLYKGEMYRSENTPKERWWPKAKNVRLYGKDGR